MRLTEKIRKFIFFKKDKLTGNNVIKHLDDLLEPTNYQNRQKSLDNLLEYVTQTTGFYKEHNYLDGIETFPVINKTIIKNNESEFMSNGFQKEKLIRTITSGSTGTPFVSYQNIVKKNRNTADTIHFADIAGYEMGSKLYYLKIWSKNNKKSSLLQKVQNVVPIDVLNLNENVSEIIAEMNKNTSSINFLGYVSAFETICGWLERNKSYSIDVKIDSIITMSEGLSQESREMIQNHFKCPVFSRYSNVENGIIAQQSPLSGNDFLINTASYYIEILNLENDNPTSKGEIGRIIVTDLFNKAMPFIRYDTGDIGALEKKVINGEQHEFLTYIGGRKLDQIYSTKGDLISSYVAYKNMWAYPEIEQYQLIQKDSKEYIFKICINEDFTKEAQLISQFKEYLGSDADFKVEYVKEIPLLDSGKRKKVVNLMLKN
jgi:phenylacetate-CoA ligase